MAQGFPQSFGPYQLLRPLGRGGMAEVFLAQAENTRGDARLVALKRMHAGVGEDKGAVEMLVEEARLAMQFDHPNIAATFELGNHKGAWYFVMEYVDGLDLGAVARLADANDMVLPPKLVATLAAGVARGLAHAHEQTNDEGTPLGVVHRDVSPQNILVTRQGDVKLIDFGVAKVATRIQQTMAGVIKGKYAYMSPEQATAEHLDGRSDLFSLGICMYEWLTATPLFRGPHLVSPFAILRAVREAPITPITDVVPEVDPALADIVHRCLAREPAERWSSGQALADALEAWLKANDPDYGPKDVTAQIEQMLQGAPEGTLPDHAIATPPISKMSRQDFSPSLLSVVAQAPSTVGAPLMDFVGAPTTKPRSHSPVEQTVAQAAPSLVSAPDRRASGATRWPRVAFQALTPSRRSVQWRSRRCPRS